MIATKDIYLDYATNNSDNLLEYRKYTNFINDLYKEINKQIHSGYEYKMLHGLGTVSIKWFNRAKFKKDGSLNLPVNWGLSNKLKKEIEDKGLTPYRKEENGTDNGGVKWLVYHENDKVYCYHWTKGFKVGNSPVLSNIIYYNFKATQDNNRMITVSINSFENAHLIFKPKPSITNKNDY